MSDHDHCEPRGKEVAPVIVHRLLARGPLGFNALKAKVDGIPSEVLSDSLEDLEEKTLIDRAIVSEKPFRDEYSLTERVDSFEAVVDATAEWGRGHPRPPDSRDLPL